MNDGLSDAFSKPEETTLISHLVAAFSLSVTFVIFLSSFSNKIGPRVAFSVNCFPFLTALLLFRRVSIYLSLFGVASVELVFVCTFFFFLFFNSELKVANIYDIDLGL